MCTYTCAYCMCTHVKALVQWAMHRYISKYHFEVRSTFNSICTHTCFKKEKFKVVYSRVHKPRMPVTDGGLARAVWFLSVSASSYRFSIGFSQSHPML